MLAKKSEQILYLIIKVHTVLHLIEYFKICKIKNETKDIFSTIKYQNGNLQEQTNHIQ